jgi:hypothetical protein
LLYPRRNAAPSADVLVVHMLSAMLTVSRGGDLVDAIERVARQVDVVGALKLIDDTLGHGSRIHA